MNTWHIPESKQSANLDWLSPYYYAGAFQVAWTFALLYSPILSNNTFQQASLKSDAYIASAVCFCIALVLIAILPRKMMKVAHSAPMRLIVPIGITVGTILYAIFGQNGVTEIGLIGGGLVGFFSAIIDSVWVSNYARHGIITLFINLPMLAALSMVLGISLLYLDNLAFTLILIGYALVGCLALFHAEPTFDEKPNKQIRSDSVKKNAIIAICVLLIGIATGFLNHYEAAVSYSVVFYFLVFVILIGSSAFFIVRYRRQGIVAAFVFPMLITAAVLIAFFTAFDEDISIKIVLVGEIAFEAFLIIFSIVYALYSGLSAVRTFCIARITLALSDLFGWYMNDLLASLGMSNAESQLGICLLFLGLEIILIIVIIVGIAGRHAQKAEPDSLGISESFRKSKERKEAIARKCTELQDRYFLSAREYDVLVLLAQGLSSREIQDSLSISAGTVNSHTRNIYAKMDVHSRKEIASLVERMLEESQH